MSDNELSFLEESLANLSLDQENFYTESEEKNNDDIFDKESSIKKVEFIFEPTFCSTKVFIIF